MHNSRIVQNYDATNTALRELTQAARAENIELIVHLLDQGISLIRSDKTSNLSPLATLASEGRNEMVMRLLSMEIMPSEGKIVTRYINEVYKGAIIGKNSDLLHQVQSKYPRIPGKTRYKAALKLIQLLSGCSEAEAAITDYVDTLSWVIDLCASAGQFNAAFKTMREYLFIGCVVGDVSSYVNSAIIQLTKHYAIYNKITYKDAIDKMLSKDKKQYPDFLNKLYCVRQLISSAAYCCDEQLTKELLLLMNEKWENQHLNRAYALEGAISGGHHAFALQLVTEVTSGNVAFTNSLSFLHLAIQYALDNDCFILAREFLYLMPPTSINTNECMPSLVDWTEKKTLRFIRGMKDPLLCVQLFQRYPREMEILKKYYGLSSIQTTCLAQLLESPTFVTLMLPYVYVDNSTTILSDEVISIILDALFDKPLGAQVQSTFRDAARNHVNDFYRMLNHHQHFLLFRMSDSEFNFCKNKILAMVGAASAHTNYVDSDFYAMLNGANNMVEIKVIISSYISKVRAREADPEMQADVDLEIILNQDLEFKTLLDNCLEVCREFENQHQSQMFAKRSSRGSIC